MAGQTGEVIKPREAFFVEADIHTHPVFCGDEREAEGIYIHEFGGVANTTYTLMILQEAAEEGSVEQPFDAAVASTVPLLKEKDIDAGVHSDDHAEHGDTLQADKEDGKIGCGYLELRQAISELIGQSIDKIVDILQKQDPTLFGTEHNRERARAFCRAHTRLASRDIFPGGRAVALAALKAGAPHNMVRGSHLGKEGILNKKPGSTLDSTAALRDGKPTYSHDTWAAKGTFDEIHDVYPYDKTDFEIANDIDAVGTMLALGVEEIEVRR